MSSMLFMPTFCFYNKYIVDNIIVMAWSSTMSNIMAT